MDLSTLMPQQLQIVKTLDRPLFVSAGAGSGKTFTLTRRIVYALSPESGPFVEHLDQVLAITFTKDAAAEIRDRVRRALIEEGMDKEALTVDDAWISTIHGMCSRILRAHALELGIDPEFTVLTDTDELMDQAVEHVLGRATAPDAAPELAAPLKALYAWYPMAGEGGPFGAGTTIKGLVRDLLELSSQLPGGMDDVCVARGQADTSALADAYRAALGASKAATEKAQVALDAIDAFEASGKTMEDAARLMMSCSMPRASKAFPKEQAELLKAEAADAFINIVLACGGPALDALVGLARAVEAEYRALKADQSALDNNDLLRMAYEALRDYPAIRAAYDGRFKMVMIDEFQDTDQMQVDLIRYLTGAGERALCTVGDAQQSIYRFRGAEVEVFRRQERKVGSSAASETAAASDAPAGELVKLVRNFRSHDEVLRYVAQHLVVAAEVAHEFDEFASGGIGRGSRLGRSRGAHLALLATEYLDLGATEAVDRLLRIAYGAQRALPRARQVTNQIDLHLIGVLELIDHDHLKATIIGRSDGGIIAQRLVRHAQQVVVIKRGLVSLERAVFRLHSTSKPHQCIERGTTAGEHDIDKCIGSLGLEQLGLLLGERFARPRHAARHHESRRILHGFAARLKRVDGIECHLRFLGRGLARTQRRAIGVGKRRGVSLAARHAHIVHAARQLAR